MKGLTGYYGPSLASEGQRPDSLENLFLWGYKPLREVTKTAELFIPTYKARYYGGFRKFRRRVFI
jgi:hypothetical protein